MGQAIQRMADVLHTASSWMYWLVYIRPIEEALKKDLLGYYRHSESTIPIAARAKEHDVKLTDLYVRPPMMAYTRPHVFGKSDKTLITSYKQLLFNNCTAYKQIYVTAEAGVGKTSFAKMMAATWCQAHEPDTNDLQKFDDDDLETMKMFDFLFLIPVDEQMYIEKCHLDDMIECLVSSRLSNTSLFSQEILVHVLTEKRCLIIIDGLDEWLHPRDCAKCKKKTKKTIPYSIRRKGCSVLTTTRPWKFSTAGMSMEDIDRRVEICSLDKERSKQLTLHAMQCLKEVYNHPKDKTFDDFEKQVVDRKLGNMRCIPFVLLHLICLYFENKSLENSLCKIYDDIVETIQVRGGKIMRQDKMKELQNIAFSSLFEKTTKHFQNIDKENTGVGDTTLEPYYRTGFLSKVKSTKVSAVHHKTYFVHRSLEEYFASKYIVNNWNEDESISTKISIVCTSVSGVLNFKSLFVFVCGNNPEVYSTLCADLSRIVNIDKTVENYRTTVLMNRVFMKEKDPAYETVFEYQYMQIECFQECVRNKKSSGFKIVLEDVIFEDRLENNDLNTLGEILVQLNRPVKTLLIRFAEGKHREDGFEYMKYIFLESADTKFLKNLSNLHVFGVRVPLENLKHFFDCIASCKKMNQLHLEDINCDESRKSKSCQYQLDTHKELIHLYLDVKCIDNLNIMSDKLQTCRLILKLQHEAVESLFDSISKNLKLTELFLDIECSDHALTCQGFLLNLSKHEDLETISIWTEDSGVCVIPVSSLNLHQKNLRQCKISMDLFLDAAISSVLTQICEAPELSSLILRGLKRPPKSLKIESLPKVTEIKLIDCDFDISKVELSPEMNNLREISLSQITMNISSWWQLFSSINKRNQAVTVRLYSIEMTEELCELLSASSVLFKNLKVLYDMSYHSV